MQDCQRFVPNPQASRSGSTILILRQMKWKQRIPGDVPRGPCQTAQPDQAWRFQRGWDPARNQAESGASPQIGGIGTSPAKDSPGSLGGSVSKGLVAPGGAQGHRREARCRTMGWEGRSAPCVGTEQCGPAQPGPHQTATHNGSLRQADNSALSGREQPHPLHLFLSGSCKRIPWK